MTDLEPTPFPDVTPAAALPTPEPTPESPQINAAVTGVAALLLGGLLLGKRGGLLAGLVGVGAKVWLEKLQSAPVPGTVGVVPETAGTVPAAQEKTLPASEILPGAAFLEVAASENEPDQTGHFKPFTNLASLLERIHPQAKTEPPPVSLIPDALPVLLPTAESVIEPIEDPLDVALAQAEGFRKFGEPQAAFAEPGLPTSWEQFMPSALEETELQETGDHFVQWPAAEAVPAKATSETDPIFQEFLTSRFRETAQEAPPEPFPPPSAPAFLAKSAPLPSVVLPAVPSLTPEDIWRLAAQEVPVYPPPVLDLTPPAAAATTEAEAAEMEAFTELFGPNPEAEVPPFFAKAPVLATPAAFPVTPPLPPLLTPEEVATLAELSGPPPPLPAPAFPSSLEMVPVITAPLAFAPRSVALQRRELPVERTWRVGRLLAFLAVASVGSVGYAFREEVQKQWEGWFPPAAHSSEKSPPPSAAKPSSARVISEPAATPAPVPPPEPPPAVPETRPAPEPEPTKIEVRPAAALPELPAEPDATPAPADPAAYPEDASRRLAETAVKKFLYATTTTELLTQVINADKLGEAVQNYYGGNGVPPTLYDNIVVDSGSRVPDTNSRAFLFRVRSPERPQGFPVCTEETPQGYKVEWEAFVQCRDRATATFWKNPEAPPARLFVVLKRSHYFEEDLPNLEDYDCYSINSPNPDEEGVYAFAKKAAPFTQKFRTKLEWDKGYFVVAKFNHVKSSNGTAHVEVEDILKFNWRGQAN